MDRDRFTINELPDEILLIIFRKLSASELVTCLPVVCRRWSNLIASDAYTLKRVGMHHWNLNVTVTFFFLENVHYDEHSLLHCSTDDYERLIVCRDNQTTNVHYSNAFYLCTQYSEIFNHVETLVISSNLIVYPTEGFTYVNNLTTLVFYDVRIRETDLYTLTELGSVYSNIHNVLYIKCSLAVSIDLKFLHNGFKQLIRFRMDHHRVSDRFLDDLLKTHRTLETVVFGDCTVMGDRWIDVLADRLRGRTVKSLSIHSSYFTDKCVNQFLLTSNLFLNKSNVNIDRDKVQIPFSITIV